MAHESKENLIKSITGISLKKCKIDTGLCYIDYFESQSYESPVCVKAIFLQNTFLELNKVCNFQCEPAHGKTIIKKITHNTFTITNPQNYLYTLNHTSKETEKIKTNPETTGTLKVTLPCEVEIYHSNDSGKTRETMIPRQFPCAKFETEKPILIRLLPLQWSKLDSVFISRNTDTTVTFTNLTKILNDKWKETTPHFNIKTTQKELEEKLKGLTLKHVQMYENKLVLEIFFTTWLTILTIAIAFLGYQFWVIKIKLITIETNLGTNRRAVKYTELNQELPPEGNTLI